MICSCDFGFLRSAARTQRKFFRCRPETLMQTAQLVCCTVSAATRNPVDCNHRKFTVEVYSKGSSIMDACAYGIHLCDFHIYQLLIWYAHIYGLQDIYLLIQWPANHWHFTLVSTKSILVSISFRRRHF